MNTKLLIVTYNVNKIKFVLYRGKLEITKCII